MTIQRQVVASEAAGLRLPATTVVAMGWIVLITMLGVAAWRTGVVQSAAGGAAALALAPAAATLALEKWGAERWAKAGIAFAWIGFACAATAAGGGFGSPMAAAFLLGPAFALRTGGRALAAEAVFFALIGYMTAGFAARMAGVELGAGFLQAAGASASLFAAGALIAGATGVKVVTRVVERATPPPVVDDGAKAQLADQRLRVAELSHELRTPLTHILGFTDIMRQRLFGPMHDRYGEYVELIHTSGRNLLELVNGLLDLSRLEAGRYALDVESFDLRLIAEEVVRLSEDTAAKKNITLTLDAPSELPVRADPRAMRQIMLNLVSNAVKFTPEGGRVGLSALARGPKLLLEVEDTGPGIAKADRDRLGKTFERGADTKAEGYGLGLALVRAFAELHGGMLSFHDAPGGGALVRVEAPVMQ